MWKALIFLPVFLTGCLAKSSKFECFENVTYPDHFWRLAASTHPGRQLYSIFRHGHIPCSSFVFFLDSRTNRLSIDFGCTIRPQKIEVFSRDIFNPNQYGDFQFIETSRSKSNGINPHVKWFATLGTDCKSFIILEGDCGKLVEPCVWILEKVMTTARPILDQETETEMQFNPFNEEFEYVEVFPDHKELKIFPNLTFYALKIEPTIQACVKFCRFLFLDDLMEQKVFSEVSLQKLANVDETGKVFKFIIFLLTAVLPCVVTLFK